LLADARLYACTKDEGSTRFRDLATGLFAGAEAREALLETSYQQRAMSGEFGG
jgi:hypothetical protein